MSSKFWGRMANYCHHLAPVVGPAVHSIGDVAAAIDTAEREGRYLATRSATIEAVATALAEDD